MKIRNNMRITALVLALVMLLPLISIPTFAETATTSTKYFEDFGVRDIGVVYNKPASAKITTATLDAATHDGVIQVDVQGVNSAPYYLWEGHNAKWPITGEVVDGKISGTANGMDVPATDVPANDDDTSKSVSINGKTYKVVTGVYADAQGGFNNVAKAIEFRTPAFASATSSYVAYQFDLYLSEDFKNSSEVSGRVSSSKGNVEFFAITAAADQDAVFTNHENGTIASGARTTMKKATWNTVLIVVNLSTAEVTTYVNGVYAFSSVNRSGNAIATAVDLKLNGLQVQIDRYGLPSTNGGYFQIDNVVATDDLSNVSYGGVYFAQDFDAASSKSDVLTGSATAGLASIVAADGRGQVLNAPSQPGGEGYYLWKNNNAASKLTSYTIDPETGLISGTAENGVKIKDSVINEEKASDPTIFAINEDGTTSTEYKVATAKFVDARNGSQFNIAGNGGQLQIPAIGKLADKIAISMDYYFSEDASFGTQGRFYADRADGTNNKAYDLFQINAGSGTVTVTYHGDAIADRSAKDNYGGTAADANLKGGSVSVLAGEWFTIDIIVDMVTSRIELYVNGDFAFAVTDTDFAKSAVKNFRANTFSVTMFSRGLGAMNNKGYCQVDNVSVTYGDKMPTDLDDTQYIYRQNFEAVKPGTAATTANINFASLATLKDSVISDAYGTKAWKISFERPNGENKYNIDQATKLNTAALSYSNYDSIVFEVDYFFEADAIGQIQNQFTSSSAKVNGTKGSVSWVDLYQIYFSNGGATLQFESAQDVGSTTGKTTAKKAYFATGRWNTVSEVINLDTGVVAIYVNGNLVIDNVQLYRSGVLTDLEIAANQLIVGGKVNKINGAGSYQVDNIKIYEGTAPNTAPETISPVYTFDAFNYSVGKTAKSAPCFSSAPALLTYASVNGDTAIRVDMGTVATANEWWMLTKDCKARLSKTINTYTPGAEKATVDGAEFALTKDESNGLDYFTYTDGKVYYFVPGDDAEAAHCGSNVGAALKIAHDNYSYETTAKVMLEANYLIEEGSDGIIETQFDGFTPATGKSGWVQLFTINMENGQFDGTTSYMTVGAWNNVKVIIDLASGNYDMYLNDVWVKAENFSGATGITLSGDWIAAKVQRHTNLTRGAYEGGLLIDDVQVTDKVAVSTSTISDKFLSDEAFYAYASEILTSVNGASIRLANPSGLRFASKVDEQRIAAIAALTGATVTGAGTLITPAAYVEAAGEFSKEALDQLGVSTAYIDVKFDGVYFSGDAGFDASAGNYIVGSIVNIKEKNITRQFAGAAYVELTIGEQVITIYADEQIRSVREVADLALADENASWDANALEVLNKYATK